MSVNGASTIFSHVSLESHLRSAVVSREGIFGCL